MSEIENPLDRRRLPIAFILAGLIVLGGFGAIQTAGGPAANICAPTNGYCPADQISYITSVFGNYSGTPPLTAITTSGWSDVPNQTIVVAAEIGATFFPVKVLTVTDTLNDPFTQRIVQQYATGSTDFNELEVWTGRTTIAGLDAITVTWNATSAGIPLLAQASIYSGVAGIGNLNSTATNTGSAPLTLRPSKAGSWILGAMAGTNPQTCPNITTSPGFMRRIDNCALFAPGGLGVEGEISDNATMLQNGQKITYNPGFYINGPLNTGVLELISGDVEIRLPDLTTFCQPSVNVLCCTATNGQCVGVVTVQILFLPVISARSTTAFTTIMYATPIPYTPSSIVASFQYLAHNSTFAFTEGGSNQCTIAIGAFSCSVTTTFGTPFVGVPNVVATSTTPSKTLALP